ncbi:MAG: amidohydrolase family protein [Acutalibacteraceae bacterium]|nr:amidohydrolase family protein [Acutalibacteraceae bacterium]
MIIDMHSHIGNVMTFKMPGENLIASMEKYNIDFSICSSCEAAAFDHNGKVLPYFMQKSQDTVYEDTISFARKHPQKIAIMPWVKPHYENISNKFISMLRQNLDITVGIKVHPVHSFISFNSPSVEEYIKLAEQFDLPMLVHTGDSAESSCMGVYEMSVKYPNVNFIMGHMGLGTDNQEAIKMIKERKNLYGDTAWVPLESTVQAIKECGADKILFGTDNTIDGVDTLGFNPKGERSLYQQYFNELKELITDEEYEKLMCKNAIRIFKLERLLENIM